ncbi:MAG: rRNA pseudouridine synthase [Planctomycetes bacterium]|nr:rRNA pseudouridine synthase [Planctomycetota bacterium]
MGPKRRPSRGKKRALQTVTKKRLPARSSTARDEKKDQNSVRLNKFLADNGVASRRACDELITAGKVFVDDVAVTELGSRVRPAEQTVEINGVILRPEGNVRNYYLLNKPTGVVCTNEKRELRPKAIDMITDPGKGRIYTVGRLDEDSTGLILLTNDGEFAQRIAHPRHGVTKTYSVRVQGKISDEALQKVRHGVHLSEGRTAGARVVVMRRTVTASILEVTLREGKNREVRRTFARVGHKVVSLKRTRIGPLTDRGIKTGKWRALSREEVEGLLVDGAGRPTTAPVHPSIEIDRSYPEEQKTSTEKKPRTEQKPRAERKPREKRDYHEPRESDQPVETGYGTIRRPRRSGGPSRGGSSARSGGTSRGGSSSRGGSGGSGGRGGSSGGGRRNSGGSSNGSSRGSSGPRTRGGAGARRRRSR